jgi:hypothetical protein
VDLSPQFQEASRRLRDPEIKGFTMDQQGNFLDSGFSVGAYADKERRHPIEDTDAAVIGDYHENIGHPDPLDTTGGWNSGQQGVLDVSRVFPASPQGHAQSRRQQILSGQEASYVLHTDQEEFNPFHEASIGSRIAGAPPTDAQNPHPYPEFVRAAKANPRAALDPTKNPEIAAWADGPLVRDRRKKPDAGQTPT